MIAFTVTINATSFQAALALGDALAWTWTFICADRIGHSPYSARQHAYGVAAIILLVISILTGCTLGASVVS